jgi:hypothetical protein
MSKLDDISDNPGLDLQEVMPIVQHYARAIIECGGFGLEADEVLRCAEIVGYAERIIRITKWRSEWQRAINDD